MRYINWWLIDTNWQEAVVKVPAPPTIEIQRSHTSNFNLENARGTQQPVWGPTTDVQFRHLWFSTLTTGRKVARAQLADRVLGSKRQRCMKCLSPSACYHRERNDIKSLNFVCRLSIRRATRDIVPWSRRKRSLNTEAVKSAVIDEPMVVTVTPSSVKWLR